MRKFMMMAALACFTVGLGLSAPAHAGSVKKRAEIKELLEINGTLNGMEEMERMLNEGFIKDARMSRLRSLSPAVVAVQEATSKVMSRHVGEFNEIFVDLYDKALTDEEVSAILVFHKSPAGLAAAAFNKSPAGQKLITITSQMMEASTDAVQRWLVSFLPELQAEIAAAKKGAKHKTGD